ncbi:hypothetical protein BD311DRAFT_665895 [Dichomitus squalens]|uniref:Cytochrome P450 n=1 Tax=Dichomitus squalens TaxID=114155 RepID=A0A4Q9MM09_9APHY|nr:hypothetical protein BD311DRAFT_665895 [Dichomitus squalens]
MSSSSLTSTNIISIAVGLFFSVSLIAYPRSTVKWQGRTKKRSLPPGPKPLPLIENLLDMSQHAPWYKFREHALRYDQSPRVRWILCRSVVVLNSVQAAFDLLDKRSANFSDRPRTPVTELIGWNCNFSLQQYGQSWRSHRRLF